MKPHEVEELLRDLDTRITRLEDALASPAWEVIEEIARGQIRMRERYALVPALSLEDVLRQNMEKAEAIGMKTLLGAVPAYLEDLRSRQQDLLAAQEMNDEHAKPDRPARAEFDFDALLADRRAGPDLGA